MTPRQLRLLRGAVASSVATIIAAVSHTIGGGAPPHPLLVAALSVFLTPLAAFIVGRRLSLARLSIAVLLSQAVFHALFVALNATAGRTVTATAGQTMDVGHQHALTLITGEGAAADAGMLGAHLIAAVLTIAMLWRGESMLRSIASWVTARLRERMPAPPVDWAAPPASIARITAVVAVVQTDISRRGPPVTARA